MEKKISKYNYALIPSPAPPPPDAPVEGEDDIIFSLTESDAIKRARNYSPLTRISAYYYAVQKRELKLVTLPLNAITCEDFAEMCSIFGAFGTARWPLGNLGAWERNHYDELRHLPPHVIKASIIGSRVTSMECYTDYTLGNHLKTLSGLTAAVSKSLGTVDLVVPGWNRAVRISNVAPTTGRIVEGGLEYLQWRKETQNKPFHYCEVAPEVRVLARYIVTRYTISQKDETLTLHPRNLVNDKKAGLGLPRPELMLSKLEEIISDMAGEVYLEKEYRPIGIAVKDEPIEYLSWLLMRKWTTMPEEDKEVLLKFKKMVDAYVALCMDTVSKYGATVCPEHVCMGGMLVPQLSYPLTHGAVNQFVEVHRTTLRAVPTTDAPRKSDSSDLGCILGSASSVPAKISMALEKLGCPKGKFAVDAYGTKSNWMGDVVKEFASVVEWYDINPDYKVDGSFHVGDITKIARGSGRGRILVDDTYVADSDAKLSVIAKADYDGFVTKMYLGKGGDSSIQVGRGDMPGAVDAAEFYELFWSHGGAAHSPEYFIVGRRRHDKSPPVRDFLTDLQDALVEHVSAVIAHNLFRSAQVWAGGLVPLAGWLPPRPRCPGKLRLGGKVGIRAVTIDIPSTPAAPNMHLSRYASGDPVIRSQLNGANGEVTMKDGVSWIPLALKHDMMDFLAEEDMPNLPDVYPAEAKIGDVWVMRPPRYSNALSIKLQGSRPCYGFMTFSLGAMRGGTVYVFKNKNSTVRLCALLPYGKNLDDKGPLRAERDRVCNKIMEIVLPVRPQEIGHVPPGSPMGIIKIEKSED